MLGRSFHRTFALVCCTALLAGAVHAATSSAADTFLSTRKTLAAAAFPLSALKDDLSALAGKTIEVSGTINGMVTSGGTTSFILDGSNGSITVQSTKVPPDCVSGGNTVRALVKVEQGTTIGAASFTLVSAVYESEVSAREQQLAPKPKAAKRARYQVAAYSQSATARFNASRLNSSGLSSRALEVYEPYRRAIAGFNPRLTTQQVDTITKSILAYADRYQIDPRLVIAVIITESGFRPTATSRSGAMGLGQLMPGTARGLGVSNAYDLEQNIEASIRLMKGHLNKYGDLALALSAYNAGPGAVAKHGGVPPYRETQNYIKRISALYRRLCGR